MDDHRKRLPPADDRTEFVVCPNGRLELRHPDHPDRWITTDAPVEVEP